MSDRWPYQTSVRRSDGFFKNLTDICKELKLKTSDFDPIISPDEHGSCFYVKTLNGMCGIMLVSDMWFNPSNFTKCFNAIDGLAKAGNYTYIMMTHRAKNEYVEAALKHGYVSMKAFRNRRSGNNVEVLMKEVVYE